MSRLLDIQFAMDWPIISGIRKYLESSRKEKSHIEVVNVEPN